ncbi:hypothetical protein B0H14DRAFT_2611888 [Mycena olivaceomarginata]|nr:hypothetical protein B0H14DRAFT_2611888 [Mycena olivaceomarginata]
MRRESGVGNGREEGQQQSGREEGVHTQYVIPSARSCPTSCTFHGYELRASFDLIGGVHAPNAGYEALLGKETKVAGSMVDVRRRRGHHSANCWMERKLPKDSPQLIPDVLDTIKGPIPSKSSGSKNLVFSMVANVKDGEHEVQYSRVNKGGAVPAVPAKGF